MASSYGLLPFEDTGMACVVMAANLSVAEPIFEF
jgi:hypothetical protein